MADPLTEALESAFAAHAQAAQGVAALGVGYVPTTFGPSNIPAQYVRGLGEGAKNLLTGPGDIASGVREEGDWAPSMALAMTGGGLGTAEDASLGSLALIPRKINAFGGDMTSALDKAYGTGVMNPKSFDIVNELQQPVGRVWTAQHRPDQVLINYITGLDKEGRADWAPNSLGPSEMRSLLSSFKEQFPEAEKIGGYRISGAREKAGKNGPAYATLPAASAGLAGLSAGGLFFDENGNMKVAQ